MNCGKKVLLPKQKKSWKKFAGKNENAANGQKKKSSPQNINKQKKRFYAGKWLLRNKLP